MNEEVEEGWRVSNVRRKSSRASARLILLAISILLASGVAFAENIDPANDGSKYAWSENLGWINLRPSGAVGPGVEVSDSGLTGWAWAENAGWISFSCYNTLSCGINAYGVTNNGFGTLAGFAWSENKGWINFAPAGAGVVISGCDGVFSGRAWSENAGWITFSSTGPNPYRVVTSWRPNCSDNNPCTSDFCSAATGCEHFNNNEPCDDGNSCTTADTCGGGACIGGPPPAVPTSTPVLTAQNATTLTWPPVLGATGYDVVRGDLGLLRSSGGNFSTSTTECLANDQPATQLDYAGVPAPGSGFFFLVRGSNCSGSGTYNTTSPKQAASRDVGVDAAPITCSTSCARSKCAVGPPFDSRCGACQSAICAVDPYRCGTAWDAICAAEVRTICSSLICGESAGSCLHTVCSVGAGLIAGCDEPPVTPSCVSAICGADSFCCNVLWDGICVSEVVSVCGYTCD